MSDYDGTILFKDWLPDQPDLNNPGLTEAQNVLPVDGTFRSFAPLSAITAGTLSSQVIGAFYPISGVVGSIITITNVLDGIVSGQLRRTVTTSASHGLLPGDIITITGVVATGTFNINGTWTVLEVPDSTTFRIGGSGDPIGSYSSGGQLGQTYSNVLYAGVATDLYAFEDGAWTKRSASTYTTATSWDFANFDNNIIATNGENVPQVQTSVGSAFTALASSGTAPPASVVGIVNKFVVLGDTSDGEHFLQWSGIDQPRSFPVPNSDTAIAQEAGSQSLYRELGAVCAIHGGDQIGVVLQRSGVTRMTYVGGGVVFQFDTISKTHGAKFKRASIHINGLVYFISTQGFCVTDGVTVEPIGDGQTDRYFLDRVSPGYADSIRAGHNKIKKCIYWAWADAAATNAQLNNVLIYNYSEKRWSRAIQVCDILFSPAATDSVHELYGFDTNHCLAAFNGTPGTAVITSGETEPNPGGFSRLQGVKPLIDVTTNAVTAAIGTRNDRSSAVTYTSEVTANSRSGFANFRSEARYHRARLTISGTFNAGQGLEYEAVPSGYI